MRYLLSFIIGLYQKTLSPDHGIFKFRHPYGYCRFYPTCSDYSRQAIETYGSLTGMYLTIRRIIRCNPWHEGGIDHVPARRAILRHE